MMLGACTGDPLALPPAAVMRGAWRYESTPVVRHSPLNEGLKVTIAIDSIDRMRFRGQVTRWFAGDVGVAPTAFGPVSGWVDGHGAVTVLIAPADPGPVTLTVVGALDHDILTIRESWRGSDPGPFRAGGWFERIP